MPDTKNAFVTSGFELADTHKAYARGDVMVGVAPNQLTDFEIAGLAREATADEVARATAPGAPVLEQPADDD